MAEEIIIYTDLKNTLIKSLEAPPLDPTILLVANEYLSGKSYEEIAESFNVPCDVVNQILEKKEVKSYTDNVFLTQGYLNRYKRLKIINQVMESKLEEALESGVWTKKDILEWLKLLESMESSVKEKTKGPQVAVQINNNYEALIKDLLSKE